jgi:hypothetical protein
LPRTSAEPGKTSDPIQQIAEGLIKHTTGIERQLLSKSIQETLLYGVGFHPNLTPTQIETRLRQFLERQSKADLTQAFLSLFFFNYVWFETRELFRSEALTSEAFEKDVEEVDKICQRTVVSACKQDRAARELIRNIEQRLRGI